MIFPSKEKVDSNWYTDRLLDLLSIILSGQPYKPLGAPPSLGRTDMTTITRDLNATQVRVYLTLRLCVEVDGRPGDGSREES